LIGAAAGAIAGILLAPDKGSETRRKFSQKAKELKDSLPDQIEALKNAIDQKMNEIKSSVKDV
jgi:gas vesicle protein